MKNKESIEFITNGPPPEVDGDFEPSVPNTVIWLISAAMMVTTFSVNYKGKPYMKGLAANKGLLITLGLSALTVALITSGALPELAEYLELVPLAADECALAHAAPVRSSLLRSFCCPPCVRCRLRSDLMGLMAVDFCFCWLLEKVLSWLFSY